MTASTRSASSSPAPRTPSPVWLAVPTLLLIALLAWHGPIPQWPDYHQFADTRPWLGIPNAANVLSNLAFAWAGLWGVWVLGRRKDRAFSGPPDGSSTPAWRLFAACVLCTAIGSSTYHWAPANLSLVFDRLPIACACAALLCAFLAERVDARWASGAVRWSALWVAGVSVAWWALSEQQGAGDLRPYLAVQFLPMAVIPLGLALRLPSCANGPALPAAAWWTGLGLYAAGKGFEVFDRAVLHSFHLLSGHTLKHLAAAGAAAWLLAWAIRLRR